MVGQGLFYVCNGRTECPRLVTAAARGDHTAGRPGIRISLCMYTNMTIDSGYLDDLIRILFDIPVFQACRLNLPIVILELGRPTITLIFKGKTFWAAHEIWVHC